MHLDFCTKWHDYRKYSHMCDNWNVFISKQFFGTFCTNDDLKQTDAISQLLLKSALQYAIRGV
jgi:hypothetical protein